MEDKFKMEKFHKNDSGTIEIRDEMLIGGKVIVFGVALTDLMTLQSNDSVDFDNESDEILKKFLDSKDNMVFKYYPGTGFVEIDANQQEWYIFAPK